MPTVHGVNPDDVVEPGDAALQTLLAAIAERTHDSERRDRILDLILTIPPLREWTRASLARLHTVVSFGADPGRRL